MSHNLSNRELLNGIFNKQNQLELIKRIKDGRITFRKSKGFCGLLFGPAYYKDSWKARGLSIKFWHEDPGFMSFSYLKINGEEVIDKLEYGSEIALTIQDPIIDWVATHKPKYVS